MPVVDPGPRSAWLRGAASTIESFMHGMHGKERDDDSGNGKRKNIGLAKRPNPKGQQVP